MCSSTPRLVTPVKRDSSAARRSSSGRTRRHSAHHDTSSRRASPAMVACSRRSCPIAHVTARVVTWARGVTSVGTCSTNVPRGHPASGHRQVRCRHTNRTRTSPCGTSCRTRRLRPRLGATTPQSGQPCSCHGVETVTVIAVSVRWTDSTWTVGRPSSTSQREQGSVVVGASAHRVALDNVEVLEVDQWLALLIIGDLAPYTQPVTGPELLPTRSAKSLINLRLRCRAGGSDVGEGRRRNASLIHQLVRCVDDTCPRCRPFRRQPACTRSVGSHASRVVSSVRRTRSRPSRDASPAGPVKPRGAGGSHRMPS